MKHIVKRIKSPQKPGPKPRDLFSSKLGIIAAAAGSAIGLGNIWRFPYETGKYGGAAFLLVYLFFVIIIGMPIMLSEFIIGRKSRHNVFGAFKKLSPRSGWTIIGIFGIFAAFFILSFYGVVAGWSMEYVFKAIRGAFVGKSPQEVSDMFNAFTGIPPIPEHMGTNPLQPIVWQIIFMFLSAFIVISGVKRGIEKYAKILMPILLLLIIVMDIRAITLKGAGEGLSFLFQPDFSILSDRKVILNALGQAFFSLSLGMGALITYGSYINKKDNLSSTALEVSLADTLIAIFAAIAIIPAVFVFGLEPGEGPGLVFVTLPNVFEQMPGGHIFSVVFFILLVVAALTSSISILEVVVAYFVEELKMVRRHATIMAVSLATVFGMLCSLSLNDEYFKFRIFGLNFFDFLDTVSANFLLPAGGFLISIYVGWVMGKENVKKELSSNGKYKVKYLNVLIFLLRYVVPTAIGLVLLNLTGVLDLIITIF